jgi:hypothetical protein
MSQKWCLLNSGGPSRTDRELLDLYGDKAVISRIGQYNLIHLDCPDPEEIARRIDEFDPEELFEDDCPICQMLRNENCDVIYDGAEDEWDEPDLVQ